MPNIFRSATTFRRCVDYIVMNMWLKITQLASTICFTEEENTLVWQFSTVLVVSIPPSQSPKLLILGP